MDPVSPGSSADAAATAAVDMAVKMKKQQMQDGMNAVRLIQSACEGGGGAPPLPPDATFSTYA